MPQNLSKSDEAKKEKKFKKIVTIQLFKKIIIIFAFYL